MDGNGCTAYLTHYLVTKPFPRQGLQVGLGKFVVIRLPFCCFEHFRVVGVADAIQNYEIVNGFSGIDRYFEV